MSKLHLTLAVMAAAMAFPVVAASPSEPARGDEKIIVTGEAERAVIADPSFVFTDTEGGCVVVQHSFDRVDGVWKHVDNLTHPNYPFDNTNLVAADFEQRYPG